jgi:hypothetical protein
MQIRLNAATLLWAATVVRDRCHITNRSDTDAQCTQCAHRRFTTWAWAFDFDVEVFNTLFHRCTAGHFGGDLGCKWCGFTRTFETLATRRRPRQGIALAISDRDDGVVKRCVYVCYAVSNILANFFANTCGCAILSFCHTISLLLAYFFNAAAPLRGPLRVRAFVRVR